MKIQIEVEASGIKPEDATHYVPESGEFYEAWVKEGYSMRVADQTEWVKDGTLYPSIPHAFKIV